MSNAKLIAACAAVAALIVYFYALLVVASLVVAFGANNTFTWHHYHVIFTEGLPAIRDTLIIAAIGMPLGGLYGVLVGYLIARRNFPGRRLKKIGDLPYGVMAQWRRWCLHRDYLMSEGGARWRERYAAIRAPLLSLSFTDDEYMSAANTASIHGFYSGSAKTMRRIAPRDVGEQHIGHFGFFRKRFESTLWPQVGQWLARGA